MGMSKTHCNNVGAPFVEPCARDLVRPHGHGGPRAWALQKVGQDSEPSIQGAPSTFLHRSLERLVESRAVERGE